MKIDHALVFTDGGCSGNPGPGGWAYVIVDGSNGASGAVLAERWGAEAATTNNRMELSAAVAALERVLSDHAFEDARVTVYTDSSTSKRASAPGRFMEAQRMAHRIQGACKEQRPMAKTGRAGFAPKRRLAVGEGPRWARI